MFARAACDRTAEVVLEPLTAAERARSARGIEKIRRRLFRRYQPADYFVVPDSERIIAATAEGCWNAACGSYRTLYFGGLSYVVDCRDRDGLCTFSVLHREADQFGFWLTGGRGHTVVSLIVAFRELDEIANSYVCSFRRTNLK